MSDFATPASRGPADERMSLLDVVQVIAENLKLLVIGPLVAGLIALGVAFIVTPVYTGTTRILPPQQQQSAAAAMLQSLGGALGGLAGAAAGGLKNPNDKYIALLKSNSVVDALIGRFDLMSRYEAEFREDARLGLEKNTRITSGKDGLIVVSVEDHDREVAARMANAYVEELGKLLGRLALTEAQERRQFFERQLLQTKDSLVKAEQALQNSGINASAFKSSPEAALAAVAQLQAQVAAQEVKISSMRGYVTEAAPELRLALAELKALRGQLAKAEAETATKGGAPGNADYVSRYRDFKYFETLFELFAKQYELARVDEAREGAVIQVVDVAKPAERRTRPKRALTAVLTTLGSGVLLLVFVFVRQAVQNSARDPRKAEQLGRIRRSLWLGR